jgi:hypothetical protein
MDSRTEEAGHGEVPDTELLRPVNGGMVSELRAYLAQRE